MRKLTDGTNVDVATGDYPNGRTRDKVGATPGTILNEVLTGDIQQFFQKLIIDSGLSENDLPDNVTNGYQLFDAFLAAMGGAKTKVIDIGDWNIDDAGGVSLNVAHGLTLSKIRGLKAIIRNDDDNLYSDLIGGYTASGTAVAISANATNVILRADLGGPFDSIDYNSTSFNRGWIVINYVP